MKPTRFYAGLFLLTFSTLQLEVLQTRLLSVISWYHLAFFVISAAMFGMTGGAVRVSLRPKRFTRETLPGDLTFYSTAFALSTALSLCLQVTLALGTVASLASLLVFAELTLLIALPFYFSGAAVSLALTRSAFPIGRVYAVDLAGAALGCLGVLVVLQLTDAPSAILFTAAAGALAGCSFAGNKGGNDAEVVDAGEDDAEVVDAGEDDAEVVDAQARLPAVKHRGTLVRLLSRPRHVLVALALLGVANTFTLHGIQPLIVKGAFEARGRSLLFEKWNTFSRVAVFSTDNGPPLLWGPSKMLPRDLKVPQYHLSIDGLAGTRMFRFDGDLEGVDFLRYDVTNLAYFVRNKGRSAVIGLGSGRDMLSAWLFGFRDVTGIDINPILVDLVTSRAPFAGFAGISALPGAHFVTDDARSWFARSDKDFDLIQMSMIDTWAATGAGAYTLSENGLYTIEAWKIFVEHLEADGLFTVSRWFGPGQVNESGRMVSLAVATLLSMGVEQPRAHLFLAASERVATLILSKAPLRADDTSRLEQVCREYAYDVLLEPGSSPKKSVPGFPQESLESGSSRGVATARGATSTPGVATARGAASAPGAATLRALADAPSFEALEAVTADLELDLSPPTDERPFFFNLLPPHKVFRTLGLLGSAGRGKPEEDTGDSTSGTSVHARAKAGDAKAGVEGVVAGNMLATLTLLGLLVLSSILLVATIIVPLRPAVRRAGKALVAGGTAYFLLLGLGFMFIELGLLQRLSVYLGHPVYALSLVLFSLILASGLGSLLSERLRRLSRGRLIAWSLLLGGYLLALPFWLPGLVDATQASSTLVRASIAIAIILPAGLLMGFGFPMGMRLVQSWEGAPMAWFWGINGAAGVLASVLAVVMSISFGINTTLIAGGLCYIGLIPAVGFLERVPPGLSRHGREDG